MAVRPSLYDQHADDYERLVQYEDYQGNLLRTLNRLCSLKDADVAEFGAGTGRLTSLLAPQVAHIYAFDLFRGMIAVAARKFAQVGTANVSIAIADNRAIPLPNACADLAIEGWSFAQMVAWNREMWRETVDRALDEMLRVLRPGGTAILIETQGVGQTSPQPPAEWFTTLYHHFEQTRGFQTTWIRSDFAFPSREEAERLIRFFWGDESAAAILPTAQIKPDGSCIIPACTGFWWRTR